MAYDHNSVHLRSGADRFKGLDVPVVGYFRFYRLYFHTEKNRPSSATACSFLVKASHFIMAAAKSDFAQKLLHDLRLRKERMAPATKNSASSKPAFRGKKLIYSHLPHAKLSFFFFCVIQIDTSLTA